MEKNLVMANIFCLSLGRSGFGKSFTTPVQRPSPSPRTASYNIVLRCIDLPRIHCNHFNGQQTQKYLQPFLQRTSKKWTLNVLKDPVFLLQATRTTIPNNMEYTPLYSLSFQQSVERNYTLKNIAKIDKNSHRWMTTTVSGTEHLLKLHGDRGGCYPPRLKARVDNSLWDLPHS